MECLHPYCPFNVSNNLTWQNVVTLLQARGSFIQKRYVPPLLQWLSQIKGIGKQHPVNPFSFNDALLERFCAVCPCLYTQLNGSPCTSAATVHLTAVTLGDQITCANAEQAFDIQHPKTASKYLHEPLFPCSNAGSIVEAFCREILINGGLPLVSDKNWTIPGFLELNKGDLHSLKSFGDFLIPAAPSNIIISCKTVSARERLLNSGIRVDTVGFGFFDDAKEFHSSSRMNTLRRFGFTAIYMPQSTLNEIQKELVKRGIVHEGINVNAKPLFRPITDFARHMKEVCGKSALTL